MWDSDMVAALFQICSDFARGPCGQDVDADAFSQAQRAPPPLRPSKRFICGQAAAWQLGTAVVWAELT